MSNLSPRPLLPSISGSGKQMPVKAATPDIILLDQETLSVDALGVLEFETVSGTEIIQIARHDLINGQVPDYGILKNVSEIEAKNNSKNLIKIPESSNETFNSFPINLLNHIPDNSIVPDGEVAFDSLGNLVISVLDPKSGYDIEIEIISSGSVADDTIYTENI